MKNEADLVKKWAKKVSSAQKDYADYAELVKKAREAYRSEKDSLNNIFWANIETLKPFLYFKQPKPYVERMDKTKDAAKNVACQILAKALEWNLAQFDFDSVIKYARNDFLISGCGIVWPRYSPTFKQVENPASPSEPLSIKDDELVEVVYISPLDFIADREEVKVWEDLTWLARIINMSRADALEQFGDIVDELMPEDLLKDEEKGKTIKVYEIWDKTEKRVYWYCEKAKERFLKTIDNPLGLNGFFPCPKPIFATMSNDGIIPVPDYSIIKPMLSELNGVSQRMGLTMKALKVSGCYDNSFPELADILNKDVTLVSVSDFSKLKENGGIRGVLDFAPIEQYIQSLEALARRRDDLVNSIYQITGVSDIMRGGSNPNETATAVAKKTNFGTLRNQDRQNDMQRFIKDLLKNMAEIICELFDAPRLAAFVEEEGMDAELVEKAVGILKNDKVRGMSFDVETDISFMQDEVAAQTMESVKVIAELINTSFGAVSQQPLLLPVFQKMIESVVVTMSNTRQFLPVIEKAFGDIAKKLSEPPADKPDPKIALEQQKLSQEAEDDQQKNAIAQDKNRIAEEKVKGDLALKNKEMELQAVLKNKQIDEGNQDPSAANIATGFVKGF